MLRLLSLALLAAGAPVFGDGILSYNLSPNIFQAHAGDTITIGGTLGNTGDADLFLNDFLVQFDAPGNTFLTPDPNYFFDNVPGLFSPTDQYTGNIFELAVANDAPDGTFNGSGTIYGGIDAFAHVSLGVQTIIVTIVPEPGGAALALLGMAGIAAAWRRRGWRG